MLSITGSSEGLTSAIMAYSSQVLDRLHVAGAELPLQQRLLLHRERIYKLFLYL